MGWISRPDQARSVNRCAAARLGDSLTNLKLDPKEDPLKLLSLDRKSIPKLTVLAAGLTAAVVVATMTTAPAQAYSSNPPLSSCAGCHSGGVITPGTTATAPTTTLAPGATYSVTVTPVVNTAGGMSGYSIVPVAPATGTARATGTLASYTATMTAPATAGPYTYTVWTNQGPDGAGVVGKTTYTINVVAAPPVVVAPVASFTSPVASGIAPLTVAMTDTSTNTPTTWAWDFGNGTTSTLKSPSVTYAAAGTYTVSLVATNAGGASAPATKVITVTAPVVKPVSSFTATPTNLTVAFADTSTNTPTTWAWDFGNGTASTLKSPSVTYAAAGTYTVTLTASNAGGAGSVATKTVTVTAPVVAVPVASFTTSVASGTFPLPVTMTDTSSNAPTSWAWTLGDGTISTVRNPSVTYLTAGTKTVTLVATNAGGASTMVSKTITVTTAPPVVVAPVASFTDVAMGLTVAMTDTSTGAPTTWSWNFGNSTTSILKNPSVTYAAAGTYAVALTASNSAGSSTVTKTITVTAPTGTSAAHISRISPDEASVGTKVTITGTGFGTAGVVKFGTVTATLLSYTNTSIVVSVPVVSREEVRVTVTPTGGTASNGVEFEVKSNNSDDGHHGWWESFISWFN